MSMLYFWFVFNIFFAAWNFSVSYPYRTVVVVLHILAAAYYASRILGAL